MQTITQSIQREGAIGRAFKRLFNASDREVAEHADCNLVSVWNLLSGTKVPRAVTVDSIRGARPKVIASRIREAREELEKTCTAAEADSILAALIREALDVAFRELRGAIPPTPPAVAPDELTAQEAAVL